MAKRKWKKGLSSKSLKKKDEAKGDFYRSPEDRVSYIQRGVIKVFVPKDGKNRIRIVQPLEIEELEFYGMEMHFHRSVGDEGEDLNGDYLCNSRMKSILRDCYKGIDIPNKCFVCQQQTSDLWDSNPDLAKSYYPDRRMWLFVLNLMADDTEEVYLWSCPWTLHEEIVSRSSNAETMVYVDVSDPAKGVPVSFERSGKGKLTKYTNVQLFTEPSKLSSKVLDGLIEFKDAIVIPSEDIVKAAFLNVSLDGIDDAEAEQEEQKPAEDAAEEGPPDCFRKEFDKWADCDTCDFATECAKKEKPKKEEKPKKPVRQKRTDKKTEEPDGEESDDAKKAEIRKKIEAAQKKHQDDDIPF